MLKNHLHEILKEYADIAFAYAYNNDEGFFSNYPNKWLEHYIGKQFSLVDPVLHWAARNIGWIEWRNLPLPDQRFADFMKHAADQGYQNGAVYSTAANGSKCMLSICHRTETLTDEQTRDVQVIFDAIARTTPATQQETLDIKCQSYLELVATGLTDKQIAAQLNRSERTIKEYRKAAVSALDAKTLSHAAAKYARMTPATHTQNCNL